MTLPGEAPSGIITLRMMMSGKDVGNIIGKGGQTIRSLREESKAKISINGGSCLEKKYIGDESCPERIITVSGTIEDSLKAYSMIFKKMEEKEETKTNKKKNQSMHLILPSSQCGTLAKVGSRSRRYQG